MTWNRIAHSKRHFVRLVRWFWKNPYHYSTLVPTGLFWQMVSTPNNLPETTWPNNPFRTFSENFPRLPRKNRWCSDRTETQPEYQAFLSKRVGVGRNCFLLLPREKEKPDTQVNRNTSKYSFKDYVTIAMVIFLVLNHGDTIWFYGKKKIPMFHWCL